MTTKRQKKKRNLNAEVRVNSSTAGPVMTTHSAILRTSVVEMMLP